MALQLRRGTDAERLAVTPVEGELVYTTDTKRLYIGDGSTAGGVSISDTVDLSSLDQDLDLNNNDIVGTGNINISGSVAADSIVSDLTGSVFADDSSLIVNGLDGSISTSQINTDVLNIDLITGTVSIGNASRPEIKITDASGSSSRSTFRLNYESTSDLSSTNTILGQVRFERNDPINGNVVTAFINGSTQSLTFGVDPAGDFVAHPYFRVTDTGIGFGIDDPTLAFNIDGAGAFTGNLSAPSFDGDLTGSVFADDSSVIVDGLSGEVVGPVRDITVLGTTTDGSGLGDAVNPTEWLEITVNGNTRYIPLYV